MWIFWDVEERSQNANLGTECQGEMDVMKDDRTYVQRQFPEIPRSLNNGCKDISRNEDANLQTRRACQAPGEEMKVRPHLECYGTAAELEGYGASSHHQAEKTSH